MFICDYCREHALSNEGFGVMKSRGSCELCNYRDVCTDVHHYKMKENWQDLIYKE